MVVGTLYEKRLIEAHIARHGTDPLTHEPLTLDDLVPLGGSSKATVVRPPRPPQLTSIPSLLAAFQNEWDALALETFGLREELARAREELSTALYQQDAAIRVITRLTKERDEARAALAALRAVGGGAAAAAAGNGADAGGDEMVLDDVALSEELAAEVDGLQAQ